VVGFAVVGGDDEVGLGGDFLVQGCQEPVHVFAGLDLRVLGAFQLVAVEELVGGVFGSGGIQA
jgi:hypothetical protein